ncbi:MAG: chromate transporter [Lachnospiraceae bacterium]|nr:chromate transporter [Lachnospiraceae bacterium]
MLKKKNKYVTLFLSTLSISAFTFGGGYVIISLLKKKFCDELHWIEEDEMLNMTAIAQSSPGAVAVNAAVVIGYKIAGVFGALICAIGTVIPPFVTILLISVCYEAFRENLIVSAVLKGMQSGIAAVIADVTINLCSNTYRESGVLSVFVMAAAFIASWYYSVNVLWIILICAGFGLLRTFWKMRKNVDQEKEN